MKGWLTVIMIAMFSLFSCVSKQKDTSLNLDFAGKKVLVVYYSWGGNTKAVGDYIAAKTGADVYEIKTVNPYPEDYDECVKLVGDQGPEYLPSLRPSVIKISDYDIIFIGSPCWWGTIANPVKSFINGQDWQRRTVAPFMTNGTSGNRLQEVSKLCVGANVLPGLSIYNRYQVETKTNTPDNMGDWKSKVDRWLY